MKNISPAFSWQFFLPKYWGTLLLVALMYALSTLPFKIQIALGKRIGRLVLGRMSKRTNTIRRNLDLCFPKMSEQEKQRLTVENIENTGIALFETAMAWFWSDKRVCKHVTIIGMEQLDELEKQGKGAMMLAVHSMNLELGARAFGIKKSGMGVYRPNSNPCYDYFQYKGRSRSNRTLIDRRDVKGMIDSLKSGERVWYAPDHDYGRRRSTFAPLFAVENACTTTGTSLLVNASDCVVVPFTMVRDSNDHYILTIHPCLDAYPKECEHLAAIYTNRAIEKSILAAPSQYMWLHRRFKTRPDGEQCLYAV
ncbi:MAG TPA: lipid A biosynthesis lauroyl acyltransferase [Vibrio sp.]|nr:lipid A biosynthesis lauroyl acyltransferase [Vibrio sp.]